ncbi:uncharacterized protein BX664DRAFT_388597 [Halteromyces radiatus]|uniref:uncharacterized protein n=1 Tax=Halteromyces radiatus TaxID=101107 RepID=UPI00221E6FD6|nr:uncharacterized protein BX664DRAFT_388597 [Halteromyces radiatus]KAI8081640.1 hypothetical protein BX664DRAFT_388597 [Halteromyces radiatus]
MQSDNSSPQSIAYSENKSTRKYVKTGKYSKKKQQQQQQQIQAAIQQQIQATIQQRQQPLTPQQILVLQQSLQAAAMSGISNTPSGTQSPLGITGMRTQATSQHLASLDSSTTASLPQQDQQQQQSSSSAVALQPSERVVNNTNILPATITPPIALVNDPMMRILAMDGKKRSSQVDEQHTQVKKRYIEALIKDHEKVSRPDYLTPFKSIEDAMDRLLPYHIYQYPTADLDANKVPLERQDQAMLDIYKAQVDVFKKHGELVNKSLNEKKNAAYQIMLEKQVASDIRQSISEEQTRVNEEQRAQQQALRIQAEKERAQAEAEKARLLQEQQLQQQQMLLQQQQMFLQQQQQQQLQQQQSSSEQSPQAYEQPLDVKYAQTLHALMQNKEFAEQYQKLTPELQQQFLRNLNHQKVAEFLQRKAT